MALKPAVFRAVLAVGRQICKMEEKQYALNKTQTILDEPKSSSLTTEPSLFPIDPIKLEGANLKLLQNCTLYINGVNEPPF